ncbi:hypothetical protein DXV65_10225 [Pseudomonas fluorescens]|nr:hypothetical protein DXV65_10225 [Pseudomonas fluorescens]
MWELACLRKQWVSHRMHQLTHHLREQARSHRGSGYGSGIRVYGDQMCGLPAKAVGQPPNASTDTPPSRASPLPQGDPDMAPAPVCTQIKCGSWLACESGGSATESIT